MTNPRVDVVMPTYGPPRHLAAALESVVAQTFGDWRLTVFDNGPGGGEASALARPHLADPRVRYEATGRVISQRENWSACVRATTAPYVAMLHDDDVWEPEVLERRVAFLDAHPECALVFTSMRDIDEHGGLVRDLPQYLDEGVHRPSDFAPLLVEQMVIGSPTPLVQRWAYEDAGWDFTDTVKNIDWEMWLRMALRHPVGYLAVRDCERRVHVGSASAASTGWGDEEIALVDRFEALAAKDLPGIAWPERARRRRRAHGHLIATLDALGADDAAEARRRLRAALRVHPRAAADPRVPAALAALMTGKPGRRAIARVHEAQGRRAATARPKIPVRPGELAERLRARRRTPG